MTRKVLGGRSEPDGLDHVENLHPREGAGGVEVVAARAVHPGDELAHVRGEVVLGGHFCRGADSGVAEGREIERSVK